MSIFRACKKQIPTLMKLLERGGRWLFLINADPDALACALALKRIMARRVSAVTIAAVNEVKRPDNLAMIRLLRIPLVRFTPELAASYNRFALLDSQPHHHPDFADLPFSVVIDHHPARKDGPPIGGELVDVRQEYGACATILTEYLYNLRIRPGKLLATALLYGIKTDTRSFERPFIDADVKAFSYLTKYADMLLLRTIAKSEFHRLWLPVFGEALRRVRFFGTDGLYCYLPDVESADLLVVLADFFLRVQGLSHVVVAGIFDDQVVVILRGTGLSRDMGQLAQSLFGDLGPAGGHRTMARAEFSAMKLRGGNPEKVILDKLNHLRQRSVSARKSQTEE